MNIFLFKMLGPMLLLLIWLEYAAQHKNTHVRLATFYVLSFAAFSSNFELHFRELHQLIHVVIALMGFEAIVSFRLNAGRFNRGMLIFLAFILLSSLVQGLGRGSMAQITNVVLVILVLNYFHLRCWDSERILPILRFFAKIAVAVAVLGMVEYMIGSTDRIEGSFSNANYFGYFLGVGYCIAFYVFSGVKKQLALGVIVLAILLSGSRASLAFPLIQTAYYLLTSGRLGGRLYFLAVVATIVTAVILSGTFRVTSTGNRAGSDAERVLFSKIAFRMAEDHPLLGVGWGQFPHKFAEYSPMVGVIETGDGTVDVSTGELRVTHNDLLRIIAELGYVALAFVLMMVAAGAWRFWKKRVALPQIFLPIWLANLSFALAHNNMTSLLFWLFFIVPFLGVFRYKGKDDSFLVRK